uniref:Uncharacterized protein n=1 Tax=Cacopsylla melanoneura TaxID=428564 RepID=A0A8D8UYT3_9HEMI
MPGSKPSFLNEKIGKKFKIGKVVKFKKKKLALCANFVQKPIFIIIKNYLYFLRTAQKNRVANRHSIPMFFHLEIFNLPIFGGGESAKNIHSCVSLDEMEGGFQDS